MNMMTLNGITNLRNNMRDKFIDLSKKKITGHFDGKPIWRDKTPEERLEDEQKLLKNGFRTPMKKNELMVYLALLGNKDNRHL